MPVHALDLSVSGALPAWTSLPPDAAALRTIPRTFTVAAAPEAASTVPLSHDVHGEQVPRAASERATTRPPRPHTHAPGRWSSSKATARLPPAARRPRQACPRCRRSLCRSCSRPRCRPSLRAASSHPALIPLRTCFAGRSAGAAGEGALLHAAHELDRPRLPRRDRVRAQAARLGEGAPRAAHPPGAPPTAAPPASPDPANAHPPALHHVSPRGGWVWRRRRCAPRRR